MAWYRVGGGGLPNSVKTDMNNVLNKKLGTSTTYPVNDWSNEVNLLGALEEKTASGAIASFADGADTVPIKSWEVTLPASLDGYSEVNGVQTGANVWDEEWELGVWNTSGSKQDTNNAIRCKNYIPVIEGNTYYIYADWSVYAHGIIIRTLDSNYGFVRTIVSSNSTKTITIASGEAYIVFCSATSDGINTYNNNIAINYPSTITSYEAYNGEQYTASLGRTIYGGTADVVNGQGEATFGVFTFDGSEDEDWSYSNGRFKITVQGTFEVINTNHYRIRQCNNLTGDNVSAGSYELADNSVTWFTTNNIFIRKDDVTSLENWKQYLQNNPLKIGGVLATPTDFTFTPITPTPETALGVNNFWADEGDSEVTYRAQGTAYPLPATLISKTITENGTYSAEDDDADGYSEVTVNVPTGGEEIPFTHVFTAGTATDQYYTATEDGIYLAVGIRDQSTGCSINLPDGGTTLLTSSLLSNRAQMKVVSVTTGQRIHLYLYDSSHMRGGWIFKLNTTTPTLAYSNGYSSTSIPNHGTTDKVLSVIALAPMTDNTTIWDKTMKCYVRGTYAVSNRFSWLRLMYGIDNEMPTISFSGGIGGQWLINLG